MLYIQLMLSKNSLIPKYEPLKSWMILGCMAMVSEEDAQLHMYQPLFTCVLREKKHWWEVENLGYEMRFRIMDLKSIEI